MASTKVPEGPQEVVEAVDSDDDEGSASDDEDEDTNLQLGFVEELDEDEEPMFGTLDWTQWDGGKIGGDPCWLNPVHLPDPEAMACSFCQEPLSFLLQIYCPLDEPAAAYHRFLYVFCCRKGPCMDHGSVLALRCQLPVKNSYLAINPAHPDSVPPVVEPTRLCAVCGQRGPLTCAACKVEAYCSRSHQQAGWKAGHKLACATLKQQQASIGTVQKRVATKRPRCVFPCFNVSVVHADTLREEEKEELAAKGATKAEAGDTDASEPSQPSSPDLSERAEMHSMRQKDWVMRDGVDSSAMRDPVTFKFQVETALAKQQVLRYDRWPPLSKAAATAGVAAAATAAAASQGEDSFGAKEISTEVVAKAVAAAALRSKRGPLWVKSEGALHQDDPTRSAHAVPPCSTCGAPRRFEFQVMPQLLHYLGSDNSSGSSGSGAVAAPSDASPNSSAKSSSGDQLASTCSDAGSATNVTETDASAKEQAEAAARAKEAMMHLAMSTLDWGTLAVFTCTASCGGNEAPQDLQGGFGAYKKEFVWRQSPL